MGLTRKKRAWQLFCRYIGDPLPAACHALDGEVVKEEICDAVPVLIYGRHRLLALIENGETVVECIVYDVDEEQQAEKR